MNSKPYKVCLIGPTQVGKTRVVKLLIIYILTHIHIYAI